MFNQQHQSIQHIIGCSLLLGAITLLPQIAMAADSCDIVIEATDAMTFSTKEIAVKQSCKTFNITLKHVGKLGKNIMGHNLVIAKESDQKAVLEDGSKAGTTSEYLKANDTRVAAYTKLIGGGEQATTQLTLAKLDTKAHYVFFCSFPGHAFMMKGLVKFV